MHSVSLGKMTKTQALAAKSKLDGTTMMKLTVDIGRQANNGLYYPMLWTVYDESSSHSWETIRAMMLGEALHLILTSEEVTA